MIQLQALRDAVSKLEERLRGSEAASEALLGKIHPDHRVSARNFVAYVTLRQTDLRELQLGLVRYGLSSLGRLEGHVLDALTKVRERLDDAIARGNPAAPPARTAAAAPTWEESSRLLHEHTCALLGPRPPHRHVYVMVTAPGAAEVDDAWVERLLAAGMNLLRVNAAHEDEPAWSHIVSTARRVADAHGAQLKIAVDLPGPKLRTVILQAGPRVVKWKPARDDFGRVVTPCKVALHQSSHATTADQPALSVSEALWSKLRGGDVLAFRDARGKRRELVVTQRGVDDATAELSATAYVVPGTTMSLERDGDVLGEMQAESVPARRFRLPLAIGEAFGLVTHGAAPLPGMKSIGCTLDAALGVLKVGHRVLFNDLYLRAGRLPAEGADDEAVILEQFASAQHLALGERLPVVINGRLRELAIVGIALSPEYVLAMSGREMIADNRRFVVLWLPRAVVAAAYRMAGAFNDVSLRVAKNLGADFGVP